MANVQFQLDCPKCDAEIVIRSTAQIGKKIECPNCKYSFVVPEMDDEDADDDAPPAAKGKGKKSKKKAGNSKVLIGAILGVLALGGLALGGVLIFGGGDDKSTTQAPAANPGAGGGGGSRPGMTPGAALNGEPEGPGGAGAPGNTETPGTNPPAEPPKKPNKKPRPSGLKEITNLLPGDAVSVWHLRMDELSKTPLYSSIFDRATKDLFLTSMSFEASDVDEILHCYTGTDVQKNVFAILRTKGPLDTDEMTRRLNLEAPKNNEIKGRAFYLLKSNAFLTAISKSLSIGSVLGTDSRSPRNRPAQATEDKLAFSIYDSQTILLADRFVMERFLSDLKDDGLPPFKSELTQAEPPPAPPMGPMGGPGGPGPGGPMGGPGGPGAPMLTPAPGPGAGKGNSSSPLFGGRSEDAQDLKPLPPTPGTLGGGGPPTPGGPTSPGRPGSGSPGGPPPRKSFTSNPYFRTIEPDLKKALNTLEDEDKDTPAAVYVQKVDPRILGELNIRTLGLPPMIDGVLASWLQHVKVLGFSITALNKTKATATGYFDYLVEDDAKKSVEEHIMPVLNGLKLLYTLQTKDNLTIRDLTKGQGGGNTPSGPGFPGGPPGAGPGPGGPGGPGAPALPSAPGLPGGPTRGGGSGKNSSAPLSPSRQGGEDIQGGGGRGPKPGLTLPGGLPPGPGGPAGPGAPGLPTPPEGPGGPGGPGGFGSPGESTPFAGSHVDVSISDTVVTAQFELDWPESTFQSVIMPGIGRMTAQLKGRMSVLSGENDTFSLAASLPKILKDKGSFPTGALERSASTERFGLPYPPEQRVSFFAELLPYLGKAGLRTSIQEKRFAWYAKENLPAAETWVPEFLVPYYDAASWRATHDLAEGRSLGATNYVGVSGLGLDSARFDPKNPATVKKLGMYGYDWASKPDDVTDGMANTIAIIQVPPGYQRPWIAGGGATLAGVDDRIEKPLQNFVSRLPDGTRGTTVLMGDGSVRTLRETMDPALFKAMVTRAGGEALDDLDKAAPVSKPPVKRTTTELSAPVVSSVKAPVAPKGVDVEELKKLQGTWKAVLILEDGKELTPDQVKKEAVEMIFSGSSVFLGDRGRKPEPAEIIRLDPTATPKAIDIKAPKGKGDEVIYLAYELEGNRLKILLSKGSKERVKTFAKPKPGEMGVGYVEFEKAE